MMASYYDREEDGYGRKEGYDSEQYGRRNRGQRYGGAYERDQGWELRRQDPSRFSTGEG